MKRLVAEPKRQLANIIRIGTVFDVDTANGLCRVRTGKNETDWLNWLTLRAGRVRIWSAPSVGEQVLILSIDGDLRVGFVLPAIFSDQYPAPSSSADALHISFPDGAVLEYEPETGTLTASGIKTATVQAFDAIAATSRVVVVNASEQITLDTPEVVCTHRLKAKKLSVTQGGEISGDFKHTQGEFSSNGVVLDRHSHTGVKSGGDVSGGPVK
ncbi:phage baseplate assembly protein V [Gibbsiella quercinecans]|uniref:phage baseplate assembly protein V n=1 Tax=Gibbsiella quercinecans TaxID=929813 RepID=UPI003A4DD802